MKKIDSSLTLLVELPRNRDYTGTLSVLDAAKKVVIGPFPVAGRSGDELAAEHGNPSRTTTLPYGDTPLGAYRVVGISATGSGTRYRRDLFGAHGAIMLQARDGDAALAEANGRFEILIHGGPLSADGRLRATSGNLRIADEHLRSLVEQLRAFDFATSRCTIVAAKKRGADVELAFEQEAIFQDRFDSRPPPASASRTIKLTQDLVAYGEYTDGPEPGPAPSTDFDVATSGATVSGVPPAGGSEPQPEPGPPPESGAEPAPGPEAGSEQAPQPEPEAESQPTADIDSNFISQLEGNQQTQGYVPDASSSQSGVTVGTGFDIGQRSPQDIDNMDLPDDLKEKLKEYASLKGEDAATYLAEHPLEVSPEEANAIDQAVHAETVDNISQAYDASADQNQFDQLPTEAKTVIASVATQYGANLEQRTPNFWGAVTEGRWQDAVDELRNFGDNYQSRHDQEADRLQQAIDSGALPAGPRKN